MDHIISHNRLTIETAGALIAEHSHLTLSKEAENAILKCRKYLDSKMEDIRRPVYGVTTGFGSLCNITIAAEDLSQLQHFEGSHGVKAPGSAGTKNSRSPLHKIQYLSFQHARQRKRMLARNGTVAREANGIDFQIHTVTLSITQRRAFQSSDFPIQHPLRS